jgi:hypothetical protein
MRTVFCEYRHLYDVSLGVGVGVGAKLWDFQSAGSCVGNCDIGTWNLGRVLLGYAS